MVELDNEYDPADDVKSLRERVQSIFVDLKQTGGGDVQAEVKLKLGAESGVANGGSHTLLDVDEENVANN